MILDDELIDAAWRVKFAASRDDWRPLLQRVHFDAGWVWATDSYRIAAVEVECDDGWRDFTLPVDALWDLTETRRVAFRKNAAVVAGEAHEQYPPLPTGRLLPPSVRWLSAELDRRALIDRIKSKATADPLHPERNAVTIVPDRSLRQPPVKFDAAWLTQGLRACPDDVVRLGYTDPWSPMAVHSDEFMYVLMPKVTPVECDRCTPGPVRLHVWSDVRAAS